MVISEQQEIKVQDSLPQLVEKRLEFAFFQLDKLLTLVQLADSKAQFILGANTLLISVVVAIFSEQLRDTLQHQGASIMLTYVVLLIFCVTTTLVSMIQAFLVVLPRDVPFSQKTPHAPLLYYKEIAQGYRTSNGYGQALTEASLHEMLTNAGAEIYGISSAASRKYTLLRVSLKWLLAGVASWILVLFSALLFLP